MGNAGTFYGSDLVLCESSAPRQMGYQRFYSRSIIVWAERCEETLLDDVIDIVWVILLGEWITIASNAIN